MALVGITHGDTVKTAQALAHKSAHMRILSSPGQNGQKAQEISCLEAGAPMLVVSQFTLYADCRRGRRPSWAQAAPVVVAEPLFEGYVAALRDAGVDVKTGVFGATMQVELVNDGPVTILLDSADLVEAAPPQDM